MERINYYIYTQGIASNVDTRALKKYKYCQNYNIFARVSSFVSWTKDQIEQFFFKQEVSILNSIFWKALVHS